ncbi:MAG: excinuclease ABC subunit UvrA, partial [Acidobacteria bacterium]|nr:excinuclease ABC subunit UvrA [Acidobacteriota bacterium]
MSGDAIRIRGAREHNLKGIDLEIPRSRLVVITGLSGSGKSSLAFDTIYAEGQRRYVESLSPYARQFLDQMERPEVDGIEGLSPAIAIDRRTPGRNPRSTVGTMTEVHDFLRLLFARVGEPHCHRCGRGIGAGTPAGVAAEILAAATGRAVTVLAPVVRRRKGAHREALERLRRKGFPRARIDGRIAGLDDAVSLDPRRPHSVEAVVDRLVPRGEDSRRLRESVETAFSLAAGLAAAVFAGGEERLFSERLGCPECGVGGPELSPRAFSFNSPYGACPACSGLGVSRSIEPARVVPDPDRSILQGALAPWRRGVSSFLLMSLRTLARAHRFDLDAPFRALPEEVRQLLLHGSGGREYDFEYADGPARWRVRRPFEGVIPYLWRRYRKTESAAVREAIEAFLSTSPCGDCRGLRLRPESLAVRVAGRNIADYSGMEIGDLVGCLDGMPLRGTAAGIAEPILREVRERLRFLLDVGIAYLTLDRNAATLSAGEVQRIRLASQLGARLTGVLYVLDEPSIGLHPRDHRRLLDTLERIRDQGNTVIVVEHDEETIRAADHVVDLGPGAGRDGGEVVASGTPAEIERVQGSLTAAYLSGRRRIPVPLRRRAGDGTRLVVRGACEHNLKGIDVEVPLRTLTVVTGVSGSGKSTLVHEVLYRSLNRRLGGAGEEPGRHRALEGAEHLDAVVAVDSSPIGRTPRSNPATYTGLFTPVRDLFARVPESRMRGYTSSRFSFNVRGGRCEECRGDGLRRIEMHFLPDLFVTCRECDGKRYSGETLDVRYKGETIAGVLEMTVDRAGDFFAAIPAVRRKLEALGRVGLGYLTLGQPATTLSGGEAQRLKIARELAGAGRGRVLYLLDEPTSGLHFEDVRRLLEVLHALVDAGNSVVMIEHNLEIVKAADYLIDLGPEGGEGGGRIVAQGTPERVAASPDSITGRHLRRVLE